MARQTAFPGVLIDSIKVEKPPFDEPGTIQEFVGPGATREFDDFAAVRAWKEVSPEFIQSVIDDLEELVGPLRDSFKVRYNRSVRALSPPIQRSEGAMRRLQKRSVRTRARTFVRAKNPFEPDILKVGEPSLDKSMSEDGGIDVYRVPVWVTK